MIHFHATQRTVLSIIAIGGYLLVLFLAGGAGIAVRGLCNCGSYNNVFLTLPDNSREDIPTTILSHNIVNAFIAAEDWDFWTHHGLSLKGIVRSIWINLLHGRIVQGASTITQQLVKLLFLKLERTFTRKITEQFYALYIEYHYSKEQILEAYLSNVYFGCGIYGVQAATMRFWGKSASHVTLDQAALLAAIVRSPVRLCPLVHPLLSQKKRNTVLAKMKKLYFITQDEYEKACCQELMILPAKTASEKHLRETMRLFLGEKSGGACYSK